jgi:uncharacterized protein with von Willebrand factor type A (vWA) domain
MSNKRDLGGIIHTYQKYDPVEFPSPTAPPPDLVSQAFDHLLHYGSMRRLTDEELARAVRIDPRQIRGFLPNIDALRQMLEERKRKILQTYETGRVQSEARNNFRRQAERMKPPGKIAKAFQEAVRDEQLHDLEQLWYRSGDERSDFARQLLQLTERLGEKYQVDELASKYEFTGRTPMDVPKALEIKEELEAIDRLLKQLEEAAKTAQIGIIDLEELAQFAEPGDMEQLADLQRQINEYLRQVAEQQGLERQAGKQGYQMTPRAYRLFQSKLLTRIFEQMQASRSGRHQGPIIGEGATELQQTRPYEFGDSVTHMDIPSSFVNALLRNGPGTPVRLKTDDIVIHKTRNNPKCATAVVLDMSGSMRHGLYVDVKRMGLALDGLIRTEYPGDFLQFIEMYTFAKPRHVSEIAALLPKPVTIYDPIVRLRADMSDPRMSEMSIPPHFTNIQHGLRLARQFLAVQDTPNRQIMLITDGLPTAHFEGEQLYLLYPPDPRTEDATLREAHLCAREGMTINIFLLSNWNQTEEDVRFAYKVAESTKGRVFFTAGRELDRYVVWDYIARRKQIIA